MRIPKTGRPKWATHFMYQFRQIGEGGYWLGKDKIQRVNSFGKWDGDPSEIAPLRYEEYSSGMYDLTVKKLKVERLENK